MRRSRPTVTRKRREDAATLQEKEDAGTLQEKEAQADRADTTMENLTSKLVEFLMYVLQENQTTEQAMERDLQKNCEDIVFDKIANGEVGYDERTLLQHKRMWDVMSRNKEGVAKERTFVYWCRRVHSHTEAACTASASTFMA